MTGEEKYTSGFTPRVLLIIVFIAFVFTPINLWVNLSIGTGALSTFAILMVIAELTRIFGSPLTTQEVATLLVGMGAMQFYYAINSIQNAYFSQSPLLEQYGLLGRIPYWVAPPPESGFYLFRSLWHPFMRGIWLRLDNLLLPGLTALAGLSLGILNKIIYVDYEKLPYPGVQVDAALCTTLTQKDPQRNFVFSISSLLAFAYGTFMYIIPNVTGVVLLPSLWIDMSSWVQIFLPGACFGIATNLPTLTSGLYLPATVIICQLIGSIAVWVFGNWLVVTQGLTEFSNMYVPGMPLHQIYYWAYQYVWMMPIIGLSMFVGFSALKPRAIKQTFLTFKGAAESAEIGAKIFSIWFLIIPFSCVILSNLVNIWYWAPDYPLFPWLPAALSITLSLVQSLLIGRSEGTGISVNIPGNIDKLVLLATNYGGTNAWFVSPVMVNPSFGGNVDRNFKLSQLTQSSFTDFLKFFFVVTPISIVFAIFFTQVFWSLAPIPSTRYTWSMVQWPRTVIDRAIWITRPQGIFRLDWISYGALLGVALYVPLSLLHLPAHTIMISLLAGMGILPPIAMNALLGYITRLILERIVGKENYNKHKYIVVAGITTGTGLAITAGVCGYIIIRGIWPTSL